jgi:hypothetical protein
MEIDDFEIIDPDQPILCPDCDHFHQDGDPCPQRGVPCGSYLCCIN